MDRLAILRLHRPYLCIKCKRVRLGWVFLDFTLRRPTLHPKRKIAFDKPHLVDLRCPECGGDVRRSRRTLIERMLIFIRPYRCLRCDVRFRTLKFG